MALQQGTCCRYILATACTCRCYAPCSTCRHKVQPTMNSMYHLLLQGLWHYVPGPMQAQVYCLLLHQSSGHEVASQKVYQQHDVHWFLFWDRSWFIGHEVASLFCPPTTKEIRAINTENGYSRTLGSSWNGNTNAQKYLPCYGMSTPTNKRAYRFWKR